MPRSDRIRSAANDNHGRQGCLLSDALYLAVGLVSYAVFVLGVKS